MKHIYKCIKCQKYTLSENCPFCNEKTIQPKPAKYSPDDKYGDYRRQVKEPERKEKGYL
ncbi:MAG: RNA-protein complex protein Nop10 [Candidatus Woesearchaeota archaeon]